VFNLSFILRVFTKISAKFTVG